MPKLKLKANEAQTGLYNLLVAGMPVKYPVFDEVPQEGNNPDLTTSPPYITIGDDSSVAWNEDKQSDDREFLLEVNCWSKKPGFYEVKEMAEDVLACFGDDPEDTLVIAGCQIIHIHIVHAAFTREPDGRTRRGRISIEIRAVTN